ncbi:MAG: SufE family protein [Pseudomonadota bacterium]
MDIDALIDDFEFLDDWDDRYRYVIELGKALPAFPEDRRTDANKVRGCVSQVWLDCNRSSGSDGVRLDYHGDSDAMIVKGLIAILLAFYAGKTAAEIQTMDPEPLFDRIGLRDHLTAQRSNGLSSMVNRIKRDAAEAVQETA